MGDVRGDETRAIFGTMTSYGSEVFVGATGAFKPVSYAPGRAHSFVGSGSDTARVEFASARVTPTGAANAPRRWVALACAYLGQPAS